MNRKVKMLWICILIASFLLFPGCTGPEITDRSVFQEQVCGTVPEVCMAFDLDEEQVRNAMDGNGEMPSMGYAQYAGLVWTVYPCFDAKTQRMYGYSYQIRYDENPDQAAPIFINILAELNEDLDAPIKELNPIPHYQQITAETTLKRIWEMKHFLFQRRWPLNGAFSEKQLDAAEAFKEAHPRYAPSAHLYGVVFTYEADLETASFTLTYRFFPYSDF